MDQDQLRTLFEQVRAGAVDIEAAMGRMRHMPFEDLGFAKVDHHRALRHGMPEVIFAQGKTPEQVVAIAESLLANAHNVLITRAGRELPPSAFVSGTKHLEFHALVGAYEAFLVANARGDVATVYDEAVRH